MIESNNCPAQALFQLVRDQKQWTFLVRSDDTWAIMRDGKPVTAGSSSRASANSGMQRFLAFTAAVPHPVCASGSLVDVKCSV